MVNGFQFRHEAWTTTSPPPVDSMLARLLLSLAFLATLSDRLVAECPFCTAVSQTLRQEMSNNDIIVFASYVDADSDNTAIFEVKRILKGNSLVQVGEKISANFFGKGQPDYVFMIKGIGPPDVLWDKPLKINENVQKYIDEVLKLPSDNPKARLKFFTSHLSDTDPIIARDVFDEFASASYSEMKEMKDQYDREQLLKWIQDPEVSPDRRKLYSVMLGICGHKPDADVLEGLLKNDNFVRQAGLDALIACYLTLKGESGLQLIDQRFLTNKQATYNEVYSAIAAIRFHGTDGGVLDRKVLLPSLTLMLDRPKLADLVILDLARWEDWSHIATVLKLFKESYTNDATWLRSPVIQYLRACPMPEAVVALDEIKQLDPAEYKRAVQFFPQPGSSDSSQWSSPNSKSRTSASDLSEPAGLDLTPGTTLASSLPSSSLASPSLDTNSTQPPTEVNLVTMASVIGTFSATLWIGMWLTITGAGRKPSWMLAALRQR